MKNKTVMTAAIVTVLSAGLLTGATAFAQDATSENPTSSLVQKISEKFGLKQSDVQAIFDQEKQVHMEKMQQKNEDRLSKLVKDGKITDAQKQLILAKNKELLANRQAHMETMKSMTADERKAAMQDERKSLTDWAAQNDIDLSYLMPFRMKSGMRGHAGFGMGAPRNEVVVTPAAK